MRCSALALVLLLIGTVVVSAAEPASDDGGKAIDLPSQAEVAALADKAEAWLLTQQQDDGSFMPGDQFKLGITELVTLSLLEGGMSPESETIQQAVGYITRFIQPDGGIYNPQEGLGNYCTSFGVRILHRVGYDQAVIEKAQQYLIGLQNTDESLPAYGGIGYGSRGKGNEDLSNTSLAVQALAETGVPADHPAMQRALKFVTRCQNLSATNDMEWAKNGANDGGAVYSPDSAKAGGSYHDGHEGDNPKDKTEPGRAETLTSYGSMTYALLTSFVYLDVPTDDPRMQAALEWAKRNYQFEVNPGMPARQQREGLYYFYMTMAKTYDLTDTTTFQTLGRNQETVDWRAGLFAAIKERMQSGNRDGMAFWINDMRRWGEGIPHLATAYMLTSLARIKEALPAE